MACAALLLAGGSAQGDVRINEFLADNGGSLLTADGQASDWIELFNSGDDVVDLSGWYLTDRAADLTRWRVPDGTTIAAGGYLVIFTDTSPVSITNSELHANFSLAREGEYLALVRPDGVTVVDEFAPQFPPQLRDISYGRASRETELLGADAPGRYRVPNAAGTAPWHPAIGALGFTGTNAAFTVSYYEVTSAMANVDVAEQRVTNSATWQSNRPYPIIEHHPTVNFHANSANGYFGDDVPFPGHTHIGEDRNNFIVVCEGSIYVPVAGEWTFAVGSDDGFRLRINGHGASFVSEFPWPRGFATTLATFNFPVAGSYALSLIFYENGGGASLEMSAAPGFHAEVSPEVFRLVGDPAGGILHAGAIGSFIETDVAATMWNVNPRLDAEWFFNVPELPEPDDTLVLYVRCADGFTAALNGTPLASLNVPAPLLWNSAATTARTTAEALQWVEVPVPVAALVAGTNTLAITALNDAVGDTEFLILPRLVWRTAILGNYYFKTPTPGGPNGQPFTAPTPAVAIHPPRGFQTADFTATLTAEDGAGPIRYTLDGSVPGPDSPVYEEPLTISATTVLRAAVVAPETVRQNVATVTWLFLEDILQQGPTAPPGWPSDREVNNHAMEYGLRPEIVTGDPVRLRAAMTNAIPSISLVTELANLFNPQTGIYVNPGNDGRAWERPVSVELIDPLRGPTAEFQIDAGLRIRGAFSRSAGNPKHALRLLFRSAYGEGRLRFPLFEDEGAANFDKVDLRCSQNYSWAFQNSDQETFIRETFARDSQRDMGMPYTRSRYYHLYLNGQYWGLYQTQERGEADYAATYLGGASEDWDCIKTTQPGYVTTASDGNFDAFHALHHLAINEGFEGGFASNYQRVKGLNSDGTPNPAFPVYLDEDNLIVFMLNAYYTGDPDSPISIWGGFPNNMYGLFNRVAPTGFKWLRHDAEHSLGAHGGYPVTTDTTFAGADFTGQSQFNPATLHHRLAQHPDYRRRFADLAQKHFYGDGALTPTNAQRRFHSRMDELDLAIIGESARWGRGRTRDSHWLPTCNSVLNYLAQRRDIIVGHFRSRGWFPGLDAPSYSVVNQEVPPGQILRISAPGNFYYTANGSDPRLPDGSIHPAAIAVTSNTLPTGPRTLIPRGAVWRYSDLGAEPAAVGGLTWRDPGFPAGTWSAGPAVLGFAGASTVNPVATQTRRYVTGNSGPQVTTTYFRHEFNLDATNSQSDLVLEILRDDGAVIYLNGVEILRENMPAGPITYDTWSASIVGSPDQNTYFTRTVNVAHLLRVGVNTLAAEVHQCNATSSDVYFDFSLTLPGEAASVFTDLVVTNDVHLLARAFDGVQWSALAENRLTVERPPMDYAKLRVTELMYAPPAPPPGGPYINDDFAWLELQNTGTTPLDLEGVRFVTGISHTFAPKVLAPGARLVLVKNPAAFATRHSTNNLNLVAWTGGNLARSGETLAIVTPAGSNILTFAYSRFWYPETFNTGRTLVAVDVAAPEPAWSTPQNWRPSHVATGTPGGPDAPVLTGGRLTPDGRLALDVEGLEGAVGLLMSEDMEQWSPCDPDAWIRAGDTLVVALDHPSLPANGRAFFRVVQRDGSP